MSDVQSIIRPQPGNQELFVSHPADIVGYGGSAGGGKTFGMLLSPLKYIHVKAFSALIFRRQLKEITEVGGLWDESLNLYLQLNAKADNKDLRYKFIDNDQITSTVKFNHLNAENDIYAYQGAQATMIGFDELTHFTESQFWYMLSRNRSSCGIKPFIRFTTNPDRDSWVRQLLDWYIGEDGYIIKERSGKIRWFNRVEGETIWANKRESLPDPVYAKSFTFIAANLEDNKILVQNDPGYRANLMAQCLVERERLLNGNWNISYSDFGSVLDRKDFMYYAERPRRSEVTNCFIVCDTASKTKTANDYSAIGTWVVTRENKYYLLDVARVKLFQPELIKLIQDKYNEIRLQYYCEGCYIEDTLGGDGVKHHLSNQGVYAFLLKPVKDKFTRLNDVMPKIREGRVYLPERAHWVDDFITECEYFRADGKHVVMTGESAPHDDQVDMLSYALSDQITSIGIDWGKVLNG